MQRLVISLVVLLAAASVTAAQLTVDQVISAYTMGAPAERIIAQVNDPATTIAALTSDDLLRLRSANVPDAIVQALQARAPAASAPVTAPAATGPLPDDQRLVKIVTVVGQGVSEAVIAQQVAQSGERFPLSVNDLIYLKHNKVPESIIVALMSSGQGAAPAAAAGATAAAAPRAGEQTVFEGLVLRRGSLWQKDHQGRVELDGDKLLWRDASDPTQNLDLFLKGVEKVKVTCSAGETINFCYEMELDFTRGDSYTFEDAERARGGNENLAALMQALKARFPDVAARIVEKVKK